MFSFFSNTLWARAFRFSAPKYHCHRVVSLEYSLRIKMGFWLQMSFFHQGRAFVANFPPDKVTYYIFIKVLRWCYVTLMLHWTSTSHLYFREAPHSQILAALNINRCKQKLTESAGARLQKTTVQRGFIAVIFSSSPWRLLSLCISWVPCNSWHPQYCHGHQLLMKVKPCWEVISIIGLLNLS